MKILSIRKVKEVLGDELVKALYKNFPGCQLYIPKKEAELYLSMDERNQRICNLYYSGKTYDEIADMMELSKDRITKIIANQYKSKS